MNYKKHTDGILERRLNGRSAKSLVLDQANDEGIWFLPKTVKEKYLQEALRLLAYAVEKESKD